MVQCKQNQCSARAISVSRLPIKNMWSELKRAVHKRKPKYMTELERFCIEEWSKISQNVFANLIEHYTNKLSGCTKY